MGIAIREARQEDIPAIARTHVDSWRTTYRGILPDDFLQGLTYEWRERSWALVLANTERKEFLYVAESEDGEIVGLVSGRLDSGDPEYIGELNVLYLRQSHQRQGLGYRMATTIVDRLRRAGLNSMIIWVLADNPARAFYEKLGGQYLRAQPLKMDDFIVEEVAYGWDNLSLWPLR